MEKYIKEERPGYYLHTSNVELTSERYPIFLPEHYKKLDIIICYAQFHKNLESKAAFEK